MRALKNQYSLSELQEALPDLLNQVSHGGEITVTDNNIPIAKIVPLPPAVPRKRALGDVPGIWFSPDFHQTPEEFNDYL
ncbi:MAG: type II toxin-antitoxin system prevent-host-death family antitoxin [Acidobacteriaceae bacterium]|nr:type II toxin-antitoxin system prevent-host-death family antitoxin [Acidobacteriaceae bacterium]